MIEIIIFAFFITFFIQSIIGYKTHGFLLNPIFIFNFIFFLHNWSFSFFHLFDDRILWGAPIYVTNRFQENVLLNNLYSIWAFFIGYFLIFNKKRKFILEKKTYDLRIYGKLYLMFTILFLINGVLTNQFFSKYGEGQALTAADAFNPISLILSSRIIFGSIFLISESKKAKKFFWLILILEVFISVISGGRKAFVILLMAGFLKKFKKLKLI